MTEIPVLSIILAVALSVLINLIIMLIMKKRSKNSRTVKMVNDQIQAFRNEVSATVERVTTLGRDTLQNVEAKTGEASDMVRQVAEGLETLSEHSRDLAALQSVCVSYKNALEKLRVATDLHDPVAALCQHQGDVGGHSGLAYPALAIDRQLEHASRIMFRPYNGDSAVQDTGSADRPPSRASVRLSTIIAWTPIITPPRISEKAIPHQREVSVPNVSVATTKVRLRMMFLAREFSMPPVALSMDCMSADPVYTRDITGRNSAKK